MNNTNDTGFGIIRHKSDTIASILEDCSRLIGDQRDGSITLCNENIIDCPGLNLNLQSQQLEKLANKIRKGIFSVIVAGDFKNGKSTLLNAMLGHNILIARSLPATAIITILVYGENNEKVPKEVAVYKKGVKNPIIVPWNEFKEEYKLTTQDRETLSRKKFLDRFEDIEYAKIECSFRLLEYGVQLIDSPGLGESMSRTRLSTEFLQQSQAVIFLLNATKLLADRERDFIEKRLGSGRLNHVFFVINWINLVEDEEEVEDLKKWVRDYLEPYFLDNNGKFDEAFYNHRVLYINAKGALEARIAEPEDTEKLEASGVLDLERELEQFLTSDVKKIAALETALTVLESQLVQAHQKINEDKAKLGQTIEKLKRNQERAREELKSLETDKREIETIILGFGEIISGKVFSSLLQYTNEFKNTWLDTKGKKGDATTLIKLDFGIGDILKSALRDKDKEKIRNILGEQIQSYLNTKYEEWAYQLPTIIGDDLNRMFDAVQSRIEDFELKLIQIDKLFSTGDFGIELETEKAIAKKSTMAFFHAVMLDPGSTACAFMGEGKWSEFFTRALVQGLIFGGILVIFEMLFPSVGIVAGIVAELLQVKWGEEEFKKSLLQKLGKKLHKKLQEEMPTKYDKVSEEVKQQFSQVAQELTKGLQAQIDQQQALYDDIIARYSKGNFSAQKERERLDAICDQLIDLYNMAGKALGKSSEELNLLLSLSPEDKL
ncbi:MAG: hypothetical protein F6K41_00250 [Symploca sp. SIO3E6]|nr:hypothetical protein [Caldora sp. SIO3E6]